MLSTAIIHDDVRSSAHSFSTTQIETEEDYTDSLKSSRPAHSRVFQTTENYLEQTKDRDNTVSSEKIPEEIETLIKKLRNEIDEMESEDDIYSVLWDFAGELVYYETHQLYLTSRTIYLFWFMTQAGILRKMQSPSKSKESSRKLKRSRARKLTSTI